MLVDHTQTQYSRDGIPEYPGDEYLTLVVVHKHSPYHGETVEAIWGQVDYGYPMAQHNISTIAERTQASTLVYLITKLTLCIANAYSPKNGS